MGRRAGVVGARTLQRGGRHVSNLLYLLAAIGLSAIGSTLLYLRHRRPTSMEYGMREFSRGLEALDPSRGGTREGDQSKLRPPNRPGRPPRRSGPRG